MSPLEGEFEHVVCSYEFRLFSADGRYLAADVPTWLADDGVHNIPQLEASLYDGPFGCFEGRNEIVPDSSVKTSGPIVLTVDQEGESVLCLGDTTVSVSGTTIGEFDELCIAGPDFTVALD